MAVSSRQDLIDYCLRKLGAPVVEINVDEDQIEDRVDEAIQFYQEYHSDAIADDYFKLVITAEDVENGFITVPEELTVIKRVLPITDSQMSSGMFNAQYQMMLNDVYMLRGGLSEGIAQYTQTMSYINMITDMFNGVQQSRFNRHTNQLNLIDTELVEGMTIIIDGSKTIDPDAYTDVYNDMFLKRYLTQLIKKQWGTNMMKFDGMQLPGGVTINGRQMYDDAIAEIDKIEEEMQLRYEEPVDFFLG